MRAMQNPIDFEVQLICAYNLHLTAQSFCKPFCRTVLYSVLYYNTILYCTALYYTVNYMLNHQNEGSITFTNLIY